MSETTTSSAADLRARLIRNVNEVPLERLHRPPRYDTESASLAEGTVARKLGAAFDVLAPGHVGCPYHFHHAQEEMFVVLDGEGALRVAGEMVPIKSGDVIFIPPGPEYPHQIVNTSERPLKYLSISTKEKPEICEYPDSGKYMAWVDGFRAVQRREASLDYWEGELGEAPPTGAAAPQGGAS